MKEQNYLDNLVGVFGYPVADNPTVVTQDAAFKQMGLKNWRYITVEVRKGELEGAINALKTFKMKGVNLTIPHKIDVLPFLDEMSESAKFIGSVNTIVNKDGVLYGDNTDGKGLLQSLMENDMNPKGKKIVILGAGGAARAIAVELALSGAEKIDIVARPGSRENALDLVNVLKGIVHASEYIEWLQPYFIPADTDIFINATPVGMHPKADELPNIVEHSILPSMFIQDVIPNPAITPLLKLAEEKGARWSTGMGMLANQAALNTEMWTGQKPDKNVMFEALKCALEG